MADLPLGWQKAEVGGKILAGLLIPVIILTAGWWYTDRQEKAADALQNSDRVARLLAHLASESPSERILAIQILRYHQQSHDVPAEIVEALVTVAATDNVEVASAARAALGPEMKEKIERRQLLLKLLAPMIVHFDRTKDYFLVWNERNTVLATSVIRESNQAVLTLLTTKAELIPRDLVDDAIALVEHYEAWLTEYDRVRRERDTPYVFVGPQGKPFPRGAEARFRARYEELVSMK